MTYVVKQAQIAKYESMFSEGDVLRLKLDLTGCKPEDISHIFTLRQSQNMINILSSHDDMPKAIIECCERYGISMADIVIKASELNLIDFDQIHSYLEDK